jgi:ABC-type dipeptide/oligopeptide/nickel transport system permease component
VILQERARSLWQRQQSALEHDFTVWAGESEFYPLVEPRNFVPVVGHSFFAPGYAFWYMLGGLHGDPEAGERPRALAPPTGHPLRRTMEILEEARGAATIEEQREIFNEAFDIAAENLWSINISTPPPQLVIVKNGFRNVPRNAITGHVYNTPANAGIETYYFDRPFDSPGAIAAMKRSMIEVRPDPTLSLRGARNLETGEATSSRDFVGITIRSLIYGSLILGTLMLAIKHPFIGRRIVILIPTLLVISVATYTIIQLPPGDFIQARILELEMEGDASAIREAEELRELFHLDDPVVVRYLRWLGIPWFATLDSSDRGLLQGSLGRSMEDTRRVNDVVGDRILLTVIISLLTVLFTWAMAIPIGIYSAVRQYSFGDYAFTLIGFIGMCIPNFLLALILMYLSATLFDAQVSGLFSPEYAAQPEWTWGKFMDLMKHVWVPVIVLGTSGTAWMIRVMRGNLLDELRKPYVVTARAKGVRPMKLLFKYPVRLALNPFISGIGSIFPQLVSGGAIVAIVLSLPMIGPLLLSALMTQDMYLAGSMLMVLSLLTVFGTLVSDLLLMWIDPRIRMGGA